MERKQRFSNFKYPLPIHLAPQIAVFDFPQVLDSLLLNSCVLCSFVVVMHVGMLYIMTLYIFVIVFHPKMVFINDGCVDDHRPLNIGRRLVFLKTTFRSNHADYCPDFAYLLKPVILFPRTFKKKKPSSGTICSLEYMVRNTDTYTHTYSHTN